jgi:cohesin loading factor subunit SCC2
VSDTVAQSGQAQPDRLKLLSRVTVIMTVCGNFKDRQSPLDDILHKIVSAKDGAEASALLTRYGEVVDVMIDGLVDASDFPGFVSVLSLAFVMRA